MIFHEKIVLMGNSTVAKKNGLKKRMNVPKKGDKKCITSTFTT